MTDAFGGPLPEGAMGQQGVLGWNLALSAGACAAAAWVSPQFAFGVALGALLETANFRSLWHSSRRVLLGGTGGAGTGMAVAAFGLRFVLLAIAIGVALEAGIHPVGLLVGLSLIVPAVVVAAWRARPPVLPAEPVAGPPPDDPSWDEWNPWLAWPRTRDDDEDEA